MNLIHISDRTFKNFCDLIFEEIGITLNENKKTLMESRFYKQLLHYKLDSYDAYYTLCLENTHEKIEMLNLITTNETYFFREMEHFDFLKEYIYNYNESIKLRIWSAASSVGAEAYSIAMVCDSLMPSNRWEVFGSDINRHVIKKARMGLYPLSWSDKISPEFKHKYCLKGKGKYEGEFLIDRKLAKNVRFNTNNLLQSNKELGMFHIVFLRNVLIYFNNETRKQVIDNILTNMKSGSLLIISQTESINALNISTLEQIQPSIYRVL